MNQMKNRLQALSLLDRAMATMTDSELEAIVATLPDDHVAALDKLAGARDGGFDDPAGRTVAVRAAVARGRMSGGLEQIATVLTDPCLAEFITELGDNSDNPTEDDLQEILPKMIDKHGLANVRLTLAASIAGEAAATVMLTRVLKHDEVVGLPPMPEAPPPVVLSREADDETKAKRKAAKERKQAEARARREQTLRAKNRA